MRFEEIQDCQFLLSFGYNGVTVPGIHTRFDIGVTTTNVEVHDSAGASTRMHQQDL